MGPAGRSATRRTSRLGRTSRCAIGAVPAGAAESPAARSPSPRPSLTRGASFSPSLTRGASRKARLGQPRERLVLVDALVIPDLTEEIGQRFEVAVVGAQHAVEALPLQLRLLADELHVLVLGVVLELRVQAVGPGRTDHVEQPHDLIVDEGDELGEEPELHESLTDPLPRDQLLQDQQVPLLVVLLLPAGDP